MKLRLVEKRKATELRRKGMTYSEIRSIIPNLSKGTLSGWLKNIDLSPDQKMKILEKIKAGRGHSRIQGAWANKKKAIDRIAGIQKVAEKEYKKYTQYHLFYIFLCLYWAEGAKKSRSFYFINSDPLMIKLLLKCLRELFGIPEDEIKIRLFIHKVYAEENCEKYWSKIVEKPVESFKKTVYKPTVHNTKKNPDYKGCCRIELTGSEFYWKVKKWIYIFSTTI